MKIKIITSFLKLRRVRLTALTALFSCFSFAVSAAVTTPVDYSTIFAASATNATTLTLLEKSVSTLAANTWTGPASGTNPTFAANTLSYYNYKDNNLGKQIALTSQSARQSIFCLTTSATDLTTGTFYLSFLLNVSGAPASNATLACFDKSSTAATKRGQVMIKSTTGGYVLTPQLNITASSTTSSVLAYNTTHLIVIKYEVTTATSASPGSDGAGTVSLFVDPTIGAAEPAAVSSRSETGQTNMNYVSEFVVFQQSSLAATVAGLRFSKTWADVVPAAVPVSTSAVTSIAATTATGNGTLGGSLGTPAYSDYGICYKTSAGATINDSKVSLAAPSAIGAFTASLTGLTPNTTYYANAYATNTNGTTYGTEVSFLTLAAAPAAPTVDGITTTSLNIAINENGNPAATTFAIKENNSGNYVQFDGTVTVATQVFQTKSAWGTKTVTGLTPNTSYVILAKAQNSASASVFGATTTKATLPAAPTSTAASGITSASFTANWTAPTQGSATFTYTVEYGTVSDLSAGTTLVSTIASTNLSQTIGLLAPNTNYYYRVKAVNASGSGAWSTIQSVTTALATPVVTPTVVTYTYSGVSQGPTSATNTGTGTSYTYSYVSQDGTTYLASSTLPTAAGSYTVTVTVDANGNYASASSAATAFTIAQAPITITANNANKTYGTSLSSPATGSSAFTITSGTLKNSETIGSVTLDYGSIAPTDATSTTSAITPSTATGGTFTASNYAITYATGTLTVVPVTCYFSGTGTTNLSNNTNLTYPPLPSTDLVISSGNLVIDQNTTVNSITVAPGGKLTLSTATLTANNGVTLQSDASGTGTLVDNSMINPQSVSGTVKQYLTAGRNWYVSIPVGSAQSSVMNLGASVVSYDEPTANWILPVNGTLSVGRGYISVATSSPSITGTTGTMDFSGTLNTGNVPVGLTRHAGVTKEGFNLVGNPYPCYLDFSKVDTTAANILSTIWYRTKTSQDAYTFDTYNGMANIATSNGATTVTKMIPPMQAFWVRVKAGQTGGTLTFTNAMRAHIDNSGNRLKAPAANQSTQQVLRLQVNNTANNTSDETVVYFNPNAQYGYDAYDSPKMMNNSATVPDLYTTTGNENLVINGMNAIPYDTEILLGFAPGSGTSFQLKATELTNFESGTQVLLNDKGTGAVTNLAVGDTYTFDNSVSASGRFSLVFKAPSVTTGINGNNADVNITVFRNGNGQITVSCPTELTGKAMMSVYNALGQKLETQQLLSTVTVLNNLVESGVYFVTVVSNGKTITRKVAIN